MGDAFAQASRAAMKPLWGNVPAHDVLRLWANEGANYMYNKDLHLLFAGESSQSPSTDLPNESVH
jgi:hypothetical protein